MTVDLVFPENYSNQLQAKATRLQKMLAPFAVPDLEIFNSPDRHFRMRAEFRIWHQDGRAHYAMYEPGEYKRPFIIDDYPPGSETINRLMPRLLEGVNSSETLQRKLFQAEFLTTLSGECLITLIYHRPLDDYWQTAAAALARQLDVDLIGRSRGQKCVLGKDHVIEQLKVGERGFRYQQIESSFTQPNAQVCEKMLQWACQASSGASGDLLELYCGNGNFTLPLAQHFTKVLATEVSKTSVRSALFNLAENGVDNVAVVRMSSEEISQALTGIRKFRRLQDIELDSYRFSTVFVDPPRAGLDALTLALVNGFERVLYISCNPGTLAENLETLCRTHCVRRAALFDQFPYTDHIEAGVLLERRGRMPMQAHKTQEESMSSPVFHGRNEMDLD